MRARHLAVAIVGIALAARLVLALVYEPTPLNGDAGDYARHAAAIADTGGYPSSLATADGGATAYRPPAYPFFLGAVYELAGRDDAPRVAGALLGTLAVALLGFVALRLFDRRVALIAMALAALFPPLIMVSVAQLSEGLFITLVLGSLACVLAGRDRLGWVVAAGALAGAAALTRTNGLVLLLPLVLAACGSRQRIALVVTAVLVIAPWSIRNSTLMDSFVPLSTQVGATFAGAYNDQARTDDAHPAAWRIPDFEPYRSLYRPGMNEAELDRALFEEAMRYAREHPTYPLVVFAWASARMLNVADFERNVASAYEAGVGRGYVHLNRYTFWALAVAAVAGAFTLAARTAPRWLWLFPLLFWVSVAITIGSTRYRTPADPFLILLAAAALAAGLRRVSGDEPGVAPRSPSTRHAR